ncbi:MAG TPA: putative molybdenum carrier protein [Burkholderiales bacterium]
MSGAPKLRIISGGQTGVDRGALDAALAAGVPCGGWCPAGRMAEDGPIPARYPVEELPQAGYVERTLRNVRDSDATLIICYGEPEGGTRQTLEFCERRNKPRLRVDAAVTPEQEAARQVAAFVRKLGIRVLNVAGPRASKQPGAHAYARDVLALALSDLKR